MENWVNELVVGSKVIIGGSNRGNSISTIKRITFSLLITESGIRFNKKSLSESGGNSWNSVSLRKWTQIKEDKIKIAIKKNNLCNYFSKINWRSFSINKLESIYKIIIKG